MLPPELQLLISCCRSCFVHPQPMDWSQHSTDGIDWAKFLQLTDRHRVQGLAWAGLQSAALKIPGPVSAALQPAAARIAASNLKMALEARELQQDLRCAGIPMLIVKGLPLAALVYHDPFLKMGWDLDALVLPEHLQTAITILQDRGYTPVHSTASGEELRRWHSRRKERIWHKVGSDVHLELHTRLADNSALIPSITAANSPRYVSVVSNVELATLIDREMFAHLAVHGTSSTWFRLKWCSDFAGFLNRFSPVEITSLYESSQVLRAGRAADVALLIAARLFDVELTDQLQESLWSDPINRMLTRIALRQLLNGREWMDRPAGHWPMNVTQFALLPGWRFKLKELHHQIYVRLAH